MRPVSTIKLELLNVFSAFVQASDMGQPFIFFGDGCETRQGEGNLTISQSIAPKKRFKSVITIQVSAECTIGSDDVKNCSN